MKKKLILIGESHVSCINNAINNKYKESISHEWINHCIISDESEKTGIGINKLIVRDIKKSINILCGTNIEISNEKIQSEIKNNNIKILMIIGGNSHTVLSLIKLKRPFDFMMVDFNDIQKIKNYELIPYRLIREIMVRRIQVHLNRISFIEQLIVNNIINIESPPPPEDNDFILKNLDLYFKKNFTGKIEITEPSVRFKLWKLSSAIYADFCQIKNIQYLKVPECTLKNGMFLERQFYHNATHANEMYGDHIIKKIFPDIIL